MTTTAADISRRANLEHAIDAVAQSLHATVLCASTADDLFVQFAAVAVIRAAEPHLTYRDNGTAADMRRRLGLTIGDWTITRAAVDAVTKLLRDKVTGAATTDTQINNAAIRAIRAALIASE